MKWALLILAVLALILLATRNLWLPHGKPAPTVLPQASAPTTPAARIGPCADDPAFAAAATENARTLTALQWAPFKVAETGWDAYAPHIAQEVGTACPPDSTGFAAALSEWQKAHSLPAAGQVDAASFEAMRVIWMLRRPFVQETRKGVCPPPPLLADLADATEGFRGKKVQVRIDALDAYRRMRDAARRELPEAAKDKELLTIISAYRGPDEEAARCADGGCGGPAKANCSAHRTGTALDLYVGAAEGLDPTSSSDVNRSFQAATPIHLWLVRNAFRFGFVPYPYEPWHWEFAGDQPLSTGTP